MSQDLTEYVVEAQKMTENFKDEFEDENIICGNQQSEQNSGRHDEMELPKRLKMHERNRKITKKRLRKCMKLVHVKRN